MKVMIKFEEDWCDEFECQQFIIVDESEVEDIIDEIVEEDWLYFGTNQGFEPGDITVDSFTVFPLDEDTADALGVLFPSGRFGVGIL